ncbi:MAG: phosphoribosylanthranilate isomerase [Nitrospinota bacterium]|nr:MAG: phosphoribosylanthranilate isomerase [Nitrospinota bacterium]
MVKVKICGITNWEDAIGAVEAGADALGFVFYPPSPRYISPEQAREIIAGLPPFVTTVGLFVNLPVAEVEEISAYCALDIVQLHGQEDPAYCRAIRRRVIKAFRLQAGAPLPPLSQYPVNAFLLDGYKEGVYGGSGTRFPWEMAVAAKAYGRIILAGGLHPGNVREAVNQVKPYGVDVSSGVEEKPGYKDRKKMEQFIQQAKGLEDDAVT